MSAMGSLPAIRRPLLRRRKSTGKIALSFITCLHLNVVEAQWVVAREGELSKPSVRRRNAYIPVMGILVPDFRAVDIGDRSKKAPFIAKKG
jgi:hypothetical protein